MAERKRGESDAARLIDKIAERVALDDNGCLIWLGRQNGKGYGHIMIGKTTHLTHRLVYTLLVGPIPQGLQLDHLCRVRACCNPAHLEPVSARVNLMRSPLAPAAINARKTHCKHGHEFTPENTIHERTGRACRACKSARKRISYAARKAVSA